MADDVKHHRLSMSQWSALAVCPHFVPTKKPSPEANQGTEAHAEVKEIWDIIKDDGFSPKDAYVYEKKYPQSAWCASKWKYLQLMEDIPEPLRCGLTSYCAAEQKLTIRDTDPLVDGIYGYADFVRLLRRNDGSALAEIMVADFKTFSDGTKNYDEQLAGYAVAVASTIPDATDETVVKLVTAHGAVKHTSMTVCTLGDCKRIAVDTVMKYLSRFRFPKVVNPKCRYCDHYPCEGALQLAAAVQPELQKLKLGRADMDRNPESIPLILASLEEVQKLIDETKANASECIKRNGRKGVTKDGLPRWEIGDDDCKYEVRESLGSRKIGDVNYAFESIKANGQGKITDEMLRKICSMPVGKLEAMIRKALLLTANEVSEMLTDLELIERGANTETLKRIA